MSNPLWREVYSSRPYGSEPGTGARYRDPLAPVGVPGTPRRDAGSAAGMDRAGPSGGGWDGSHGFDPQWHDPNRGSSDPGRRGRGGSGWEPPPRPAGDGVPTRRMPAQPGITQPGPMQLGAAPAGRTRPPQPVSPRQAPDEPEDPRTGGRAARPRSFRPEGVSGEPTGPGRWGSLRAGPGVCIIIASAVAGAVGTVLTRTSPGLLLGACVVAGTVVAALAVRPRSGRVIFPAPVLCYLIAALAAGIIHDRSADTTKTALAINATQWVADGFFAMALATVLAIVLVAVRWYLRRRSGRVQAAAGRPASAARTSRRPRGGTGQFGGTGDRRDPEGWGNPRPPGNQQSPPGWRPPGPDQGPGWPPDRRTGRRPGAGPYNFSSGA